MAIGVYREMVKARKNTLILTLTAILFVAAVNAVILSIYAACFGPLIEFPFPNWRWMLVALALLGEHLHRNARLDSCDPVPPFGQIRVKKEMS